MELRIGNWIKPSEYGANQAQSWAIHHFGFPIEYARIIKIEIESSVSWLTIERKGYKPTKFHLPKYAWKNWIIVQKLKSKLLEEIKQVELT